jgi:hypothetical protein
MEYRPLNDVEQIAQVFRAGSRLMSRAERLERWATLLEQSQDRRLRPLMRIEFLSKEERMLARADDTPLSIAHDDPVLRAQGLNGDTVGDAISFFNLSDEELHHLVCDCHYHGTMTGKAVADRVRSVANRTPISSLWHRLSDR